MSLRVAELESLFTVNITPFEQGAQKVEATQRRLDGTTVNVNVDTNAVSALASLDRVESSVRSLPDGDMKVEADTAQASRALDDLGDEAGEAGADAGKQAGDGLSDELIAAIVSIPIAGAIVGVGVVAGKALFQGIEDGLGVETGRDRLMATTGLDPETVATLGRAAGEAYASNWGESVNANLDSARLAVQTSLLDPEATKRDAQQIISDLAGVSDLIEEDTARVARSAGQLIKTGVAANATEAFDIIVKGQRAGLNVSEDWLDTLDEYSTQFRALGLDGPQALGLLRQAVQGGARDTDTAADALKEFAIRGKELDDSGDAYKRLGFNAEDMAKKVASGGDDASGALSDVLKAVSAMEDPVARSATVVELFGTKAEDMGDALFAMDLSSAVDELGSVEGAASTALAALTDNTQNDIDTAQRNIETAANGIKGALASAFSPQIEGAATFVTENREAVIGFLLDVANGAFDVGRAIVEGFATGTEAIGSFISGPMADLGEGFIGLLHAANSLWGVDLSDQIGGLEDVVADMRTFEDTTASAADTIREELIKNGIDPAQERLNEFGDGLLADARVHDATSALARSIDAVGYAAVDGENLLDGFSGKVDKTTASGSELDKQLRDTATAMEDQSAASILAGESGDTLTEITKASYDALIDQLEAMGLTKDEAENLAEAYGAIPADVNTSVIVDSARAEATLVRLQAALKMPGVVITAEMREQGGYYANRAHGSIDVKGMAQGGFSGMSPLDPVAQMVPPGTLRVIGDRLDVDEAFIPMDKSPRSMALLMEAMRRMGVMPMAQGGISGSPTIIPQSVRHDVKAPTIIERLYLSGDSAFENNMARRRYDSVIGG